MMNKNIIIYGYGIGSVLCMILGISSFIMFGFHHTQIIAISNSMFLLFIGFLHYKADKEFTNTSLTELNNQGGKNE